MEDFITYEQAKNLKELGFDWECNHYYRFNGIIQKQTKSDYFNFNHISYLISAPNLAQVQKWLRNVKKIETYAFMDFDGEIPNNKWIWVMREFSDFLYATESSKVDSEYFTYEEALSGAINRALEFLTESKNETK